MSRKVRSTSPDAIARRNAAFAKLSLERKRVVVAKDVIAALNAKRFKARCNVYLSASIDLAKVAQLKGIDAYSDAWYAKLTRYYDSDAQTALLKQELRCEACAIGSVFVCAVERMDKISVEDFKTARSSSIREYLVYIIEVEQLDLMEIAFERTDEFAQSRRYRRDRHESDRPRTEDAESEIDVAVEFGRSFEDTDADDEGNAVEFDADGCMRAIMQNIIDNGGEFRP